MNLASGKLSQDAVSPDGV